ncbi:toxin-antitoxin system HicB family antitoxin [Sphingomicrobium astaxanthinifaciens]|uniref:toxin-antitoxin system HicB family antitoxin n=1 Tax=Sphingomicrobium astaxanthinifaciens TaxID=1227949 RepID=UPI001FCC52CE|nr:toxin-antitoxin system HicB family antitoxin [Sphingomicrobium astaxanthinifaciens]MCJ7421097.1 toxin-antitoxin system HicB family antitoxin [Sphingomicrobium astaxanthinifaciens]
MAKRKAFPLRLDPALYERIEMLAAIELRSTNAEIEILLREALKRRGVDLDPPQPVKRGRPPKKENP